MKLKLLVLLLALTPAAIKTIAQGNTLKPVKTTIECFIQNSSGKKILLGNKPKAGMGQTFKVVYFDSVYSVNDRFKFVAYLKEPIIYSIEMEGIKGWKPFIVSPGEKINISGTYDSFFESVITGSKEDSLFALRKLGCKLYTDSLKSKKLMSLDTLNFYLDKIDSVGYVFINEHNNSLTALMVLHDLSIKIKADPDFLKKNQQAFNGLSERVKGFKDAKKVYDNLFVLPYAFKPGTKFPAVTLHDYSGTSLDMSALIKKNKYVLVDFWATWCAPCISEFAHYKDYYNDLHAKGFEMVSFSYDTDQERYLKFFAENKLPWITISELKGDASEVNSIFSIKWFPSNFLINQQGTIELVNAKPDSIRLFLEEKLKE